MREYLSPEMENNDNKKFPYDIKNPEAIVLAEEIAKNERIAEHLEFLKKHHLPSFEHSMRVGTLSADLCIENNLDQKSLMTITSGGILHDLGKCVIPIEILNKTSALSDEEMKLIRTHTRAGYDKLKDPFFDGIREIVVSHHEFTKENPYPRSQQEKSNVIKLNPTTRRTEKQDGGAALVAVADFFDALSVQRPYNPEFSFDEIKKIIEKNYSGPQIYIDQILKRYKLN